jgi:FKBP-type peptidyl-prolyl cis-trans isomerase
MRFTSLAITSLFVVIGLSSSGTEAWSTPTTPNKNSGTQMTRKSMLQTLVQGGVATAAATVLAGQQSVLPAFAATVESLPTGVSYEVVKSGDGPKPEVGELVAIRFAAYFGDRKIDDIFETPEPYYTRLGSGGLLKGVESTLPLMRVGDRWKLTIPVSSIFVYGEAVKYRPML